MSPSFPILFMRLIMILGPARADHDQEHEQHDWRNLCERSALPDQRNPFTSVQSAVGL